MRKATIRHFALVILFLINLCIVMPASAHGGEPRLEISAERLSPGETLQIRGVEFEYDQEVAIELIGNQVEIPMGTTIADAEGIFLQNLVLPEALAAGNYAVRARSYDHLVISPLFNISGAPIIAQEDTGVREQSDLQLGPLPTLADVAPIVDSLPAAASTLAPQVQVEGPTTVRDRNTTILILGLLLSIVAVAWVGLKKRAVR